MHSKSWLKITKMTGYAFWQLRYFSRLICFSHLGSKFLRYEKYSICIHCNKFLRIYVTNHLNLTLNYTVRVANIDFI